MLTRFYVLAETSNYKHSPLQAQFIGKIKTVRLQFFAARGTLWNAPAADFWPKTRTVAGISETPPAHQTTAPNQATSSA